LWLTFRERQQAAESQTSALAAALKAMEARMAELSQPAVAAPAIEAGASSAAVARKDEEVTPETLVMIAAAVTAYLGKKVRVSSAKLLLPTSGPVANPWVQRGRVLVQCSHHPRSRR
jgi:hypothetical protein